MPALPDMNDQAPANPAHERPTLPALIGRILLGLVPLLVLIVVLEAGLWALGLAEQAPHVSTSRGFDPNAQYLVADPDIPGGWKTHVKDQPELEMAIPPRSDAVRVLLMGGSNTELFPADLLQQYLNEDAEQKRTGIRWEVVNLGRAGYGSERVLIYLEQAMQLEPDLVVIYAGHNEFVEAGFADELGLGTGGFGITWTQRAAGALQALRSFRVLSDAFGVESAGSSAWADGGDKQGVDPNAPEPWEPAVRANFSLNPAETQRYYDAYEKNLAAMCDVVTRADAKVLVCTPVGNVLVPPTNVRVQDWAKHVGLTSDEQRSLSAKLKAVVEQIPERFVGLITAPKNLRVFTWYSSRMDKVNDVPFDAPRLRPLGAPLAEAPEMTGGRERASVEGAHWPDPAEWGIESRELMTGVATMMERKLTADERARLLLCAEGYEQAVVQSGEMPRLVYSWAMVLWLLGQDDTEAVRLLQDARDRDSAPRAANTPIWDAIQRVAEQYDDVTLLDTVQVFEAANTSGLVGFEVMMDACHLQPGARVVLMRMLADALPPLLEN